MKTDAIHETEVVGEGHPGKLRREYTARCSCGWAGTPDTHYEIAQTEAAAHTASVELEAGRTPRS